MSFTASLFGSISRILSSLSPSSSSLSSTNSEPDMAGTEPYPRQASARWRPSSAVDLGGYWSWDRDGGMVLRRRHGSTDQDGFSPSTHKNLAARPHVSSVFACQPPGAYYTPSQPHGFPSPSLSYDDAHITSTVSTLAIDEPSFDISLDSSVSDDIDHDASLTYSFTIPDAEHDHDEETDAPLAYFPPKGFGIGLGIDGLFNANGAPFDGTGIVGLGLAGEDACDDLQRGLSRTFLEEAAWTWQTDPHHRMLSVISEGSTDDEDLDVEIEYEAESIDEGDSVASTNTEDTGNVESANVKTKVQFRDLSTLSTRSSQLKQRPRPIRSDTAPAPSVRSETPGPRRARASSHPQWRI